MDRILFTAVRQQQDSLTLLLAIPDPVLLGQGDVPTSRTDPSALSERDRLDKVAAIDIHRLAPGGNADADSGQPVWLIR